MVKIQSDQIATDLEFQFQELALGDGSNSNPSLAFTNDPNSGLYSVGADNVGFVAGGTDVFNIGTTRLQMALPIFMPDGTGAAPSLTFSSDTDSGIYLASSGNIGATVAGSQILNISANGLGAINGTVTNPSYNFTGDSDTGIYLLATNQLGFTANGVFSGAVGEFNAGSGHGFFTPDGTAASPAYTFNADSNTGIYRVGADSLGFSTTGVGRMELTGGTLRSIGATGLTVQAADGSATEPSFSFLNGADTGMYVNSSNGDLNFAEDGVQVAILNQTGWITTIDGTSSVPAIRWSADSDTGIYRGGANVLNFVSGSGAIVSLASNWSPLNDNSISSGQTGKRWTAVWAVNGTIQTSHSSTKQNIVDIDPDVLEIPRGVFFDRDGKRRVGYLNDNLPQEARPIDENGNVLPKENYEDSVIGILCANARKQQALISELQAKITDLESRI